MKILHTGDLHIGKIIGGVSLLEDQKYILGEILKIIEEENIEAVAVSGDIYDRSVPPVEAVDLMDDFITKIIMERKIPLLIIAGNHDSPDRINFGSRIFKGNNLYIKGVFDGKIERVTVNDDYGPINFYLLPYLEPAGVRDILKDEKIKNHDLAFKEVLEIIKENIKLNERNIAVAHGYVLKEGINLELSDSERPLSIGGTEGVDADYFKIFDYTALGHLHGPQISGYKNIRYSGSPMKYSFSEYKQRKSVTIVDLKEKGNIEIYEREIVPLRDLRVVEGPLKELLNPSVYNLEGTNKDDYLKVILTDKGELLDPIGKLKMVYPNVLELERVENSLNSNDERVLSLNDIKQKSELELFKSFYTFITNEDIGDSMEEIVKDSIDKALKSGGEEI